MRALAGGEAPEEYFLHHRAFPMLSLPWWLEESILGRAEPSLQAELAYSSISGYYFVRLVDDTMDGERPVAPELLPALIVLHAEFQHTCARLFASDHSFWADFFRFSYEAAETASIDASLTEVTRDDFVRVSSRKVAGAKLPLAAVCHRYGRPELLDQWTGLVDVLGRWHQMLNDIQGWRRDAERGASTYFLSEGRRRLGTDDQAALVGWLVDEGLDWGLAELDGWMGELFEAAADLNSTGLVAYLEERRRMQERDREVLAASVERLRELARAFG